MPSRKTEPKKYCAFCKARLHRKVYNGRLEDYSVFRRRKYCDQLCMAEGMVRKEVGKSAHHRRARKHRRDVCERCGSTEGLHVHHRDGDWKNDHPSNFETVCETCHGKEHGKKRGDIMASRQWIEREQLAEIWVVCRDAMLQLQSSNDPADADLVARLRAILHKGGQL